MKLIKTLALTALVAGSAATAMATKPLVIAHRGYWDTEGSAQNSIRSLVKADSIGCYASEFDVWMTSDGVLVVNHDPEINGVHIESTPSYIVLAEKLSNGENIPTLEQYLQAATKLNTRLVLELKTHDSRRQEKAAIEGIIDLVKKYNLQDKTDYITFSRDGFKQLIKAAPANVEVSYLSGDYTPGEIKFLKGEGIDYKIDVMKKHPEWIADCHKKGLKVNVWTVNSPEDMQWCIDNGVDYITTNDPEGLQKMLK